MPLEREAPQIDGFFSRLPYKCHQNRVPSAGYLLEICPWVASRAVKKDIYVLQGECRTVRMPLEREAPTRTVLPNTGESTGSTPRPSLVQWQETAAARDGEDTQEAAGGG